MYPPGGAPSTAVIVTPAEEPIVEPGTPLAKESSEEPIVEPTTPRAEPIAGFLQSESDQETPEQGPADPSSTSPLTPTLGDPVPAFKLDPEPIAEPTNSDASDLPRFRIPRKRKQKTGLPSSSSSGASSSSSSYSFSSKSPPPGGGLTTALTVYGAPWP